MHLRAVELRDWRSYKSARFEFPKPQAGKNVILIRAPNEHGKTSFFEAVTLGLFGREGLGLIPRAKTASTGDAAERLNTTYSQFLTNAFHWRALAEGRTSCSVTIEAEDEDGDPISLTRKWYFRNNGEHRLYDDDLHIFEGVGRVPASPPATSEDKDGWYRDFIARNFIPPSLAEFFLFDGEQVQRYASRGMSDQVRQGIEGLLGLPVLRSLRDSLARYAQERRRGTASPSDITVKAVEAEIERIEAEIAEHRRHREEAATLLPKLNAESEELSQQLGRYGEGTKAALAELIRDESSFRDDAQRTMEILRTLLADDVALALAGGELRNETVEQLRRETKRETWEAGRNEGSANLDRYLSDLKRRIGEVTPKVEARLEAEILVAAKDAWEALWYPPPEGCAEEYLHVALRGTTRVQAMEKLEAVSRRSGTELVELVNRFHTSVETAEAKKREWLELEHVAPEAERLSARLREVSTEVGRLQAGRDSADRTLTALEAQLAAKRQELGRYIDRIGRGAPALKRARYADAFADLIEQLLEEAVPTEVGAVAEEMTKAWKAMAHMSHRVDRIEITETCEVRMLNSRGEDLHGIDKSAGASQVFTQSLIRALTNVSGRNFPFIVDTPLARLSKEQRLSVLKTFTDRPGQVILLSTDEEVVDDKLQAIRDRIIASYELQVVTEDGVAVTSVAPLRL